MSAPIMGSLGAFDLHEVVGRGGMGVVGRGIHRRSGVPVAIKLLTVSGARRASYRALFRSEVRAVAGLSHPHVVRVHDHGEIEAPLTIDDDTHLDAGTPYLVMEWADGGTLSDTGPASDWGQLRRSLEVLLEALAHVHARDVIHRDLKPGNVLRCTERSPRPGLKLADFGIADLGPVTDREKAYGTPSFMAPEQVEARAADQGPWTDLYALGCMVYSLARGASPFYSPARTPEEISAAQIVEDPPPLRVPFPVPKALEGWTRRLLAKSPYERFRCAADALHRLRELDPRSAGGPVSADAFAEPASTSDVVTVLEGTLSPPGPHEPVEIREDDRPPLPERWEDAEAEEAASLTDAGLGLFGLRPIPLVGRRAERDALWDALVEVDRSSRPRCVVLEGAAGAGKSRLARWLTVQAREKGAGAPLVVTHSPDAGPHDGLGAALRRSIGAVDVPPSEAVVRLIDHCKAIGEVEPEQWYALAPVVSPALRGRSARAGGAEERAASLARYFRKLGRGRPAILVLDDAQWSLDGLDLAASLLDEEDLRLLLVVTVREDALVDHPRERRALERVEEHARARVVPVRALSDEEHAQLVARLLGLAPDLARRVSERTAGNPLFAVQLVGDWVARGLLEVGPRGFEVRRGTTLELPDSLHALWSTRLSRALRSRGETDRVALEIAATLGLSVASQEWADACREAGVAAPEDLVERLILERLAQGDPSSAGTGWSFVHAMLRESVLRDAREAGRLRDHHRACARMLVATDARSNAARLARHLVASGSYAPALEAFREAVAERIASGRYPAAKALLNEHDDAVVTLGLGGADPRVALGRALAARVAQAERRFSDAVAICADAVEALGEQEEPAARAARAELLLERARSEIFVAEPGDARACAAEALAIARPLRRPVLVAAALQLLSQTDLVRGDVPGAVAQAAEALSLFEEHGESFDITRTLLSVANCLKIAGQVDQARAHAERARKMAREIGWRRGVATAVTVLGELARAEGRLRAAERYFRLATAMHAEVRDDSEAFSMLNLGLVLNEQGRHADARELLERCLAKLRERDMLPLTLGAHLFLLAASAGLGDWEAFDAHLAEAEQLSEDRPLVDPDLASAARHAASLARDAGKRARAAGALRVARQQLEALGDEAGLREVDARLAELGGA